MLKRKLFKTWERVPSDSIFRWVRYADGTVVPEPSDEEIEITLEKNEIFPPVYSAEKEAIWEKIK